jgi:hypothetical protein
MSIQTNVSRHQIATARPRKSAPVHEQLGAPEVSVSYDRERWVTVGRLTAKLPGTIEALDLAEQFDPQAWSRSGFFAESYKVVRTADGYARDEHAPPVGTSWSGQLFEHFRMAPGRIRLCYFLNILNIEYRVSPRVIRLDYSLHRPMAGAVWFSPVSLGVDVDFGHVLARQTSGGVELEVVKHVRFVELRPAATLASSGRGLFSGVMNQAAPFALNHWLRAVTRPLCSGPGSEIRPNRAPDLVAA